MPKLQPQIPAIIPENTIIVDPDADIVTGESYTTWSAADAWITANVTPARNNAWAIEIHGSNSEDIVVREWVTIQGISSTILTGNVTLGGYNLTYYDAYNIQDCTLTNFTVGGSGSAGVLNRCKIQGGTAHSTFCILSYCWVESWTCTSDLFMSFFFCSIFGAGGTLSLGTNSLMINGYVTGATVQGGTFVGAQIDNNTWSFSGDTVELENCYLNTSINMSGFGSAATLGIYNCSFDSETITIGAGNTLITDGGIDNLTVVKDGGTHIIGKVYSGGRVKETNTYTANHSVGAGEDVAIFNGSGLTCSLQTAIGKNGQQFTIKNINASDLTVDAFSTQTIDGNLTVTLSQWDSIDIISDGSNWIIK